MLFPTPCEPTAPMTTYAAAVSAAVGHYHDPNVRHRPTMEDEIAVHECEDFPGLFVGVYDGHGGSTAAQYLRQLLHRLFLDVLLDEELAIAPRNNLGHSAPPSPSPSQQQHQAQLCVDAVQRRQISMDDDDMHSTCSTPPFEENDQDDDEDQAENDEDHDEDEHDGVVDVHINHVNSQATGAVNSSHQFVQNLLTHPLSPSSSSSTVTKEEDSTDTPVSVTTTSSSSSSKKKRRRALLPPRRKSPAVVVQHPANTTTLDVCSALRSAYAKMDAVLKLRNCARVGATAVTAFVRRAPTSSATWQRMLTIANCGDSRAVLCRAPSSQNQEPTPLELTSSHRPCTSSERCRIEQAGGFVSAGRVNGVLNVSRAFGDHWMKSIVPCEPHVCEVVLDQADEFVVLACDGLWDFVDDNDVIIYARRAFQAGMPPHAVARVLVTLAIERGSTDNVSVLVVLFNVDDDE